MTSFNDIFKSSFLENFTSVSLVDMLIALVLAFLIGLFIYFIYKKTYNGVMVSTTFGITLIALTMITTIVILAVSSNIVLSLGMVGALSIVRFRTAIKEPLDIAFLFWSIAVGIVLAAGMIPLAVVGSILIGIMLLVFVNKKRNTKPYIAVVKCDSMQAQELALETLKARAKRCEVKCLTARDNGVELNAEVRLLNNDTAFVGELNNLQGVNSAVLVSYNGDYMG